MTGYLIASVFTAIIGAATVVSVLWVLLRRANRRAELARHKRQLASEAELDDFIRRVDQVTAADELDHLEEGDK